MVVVIKVHNNYVNVSIHVSVEKKQKWFSKGFLICTRYLILNVKYNRSLEVDIYFNLLVNVFLFEKMIS